MPLIPALVIGENTDRSDNSDRPGHHFLFSILSVLNESKLTGTSRSHKTVSLFEFLMYTYARLFGWLFVPKLIAIVRFFRNGSLLYNHFTQGLFGMVRCAWVARQQLQIRCEVLVK